MPIASSSMIRSILGRTSCCLSSGFFLNQRAPRRAVGAVGVAAVVVVVVAVAGVVADGVAGVVAVAAAFQRVAVAFEADGVAVEVVVGVVAVSAAAAADIKRRLHPLTRLDPWMKNDTLLDRCVLGLFPFLYSF